MSNNILALDLGVAMGVCRALVNGVQDDYTTEIVAPWQRGTHALSIWKDWIEGELASSAYDLIVIEDYARGQSVMREESGERCGVFKVAAYQAGITVLMVNQSQVKKWAYGNTKDKDSDAKQEVRSRAEREFGYELVKNDHNADSLYLAQIGGYHLNGLGNSLAYRREVLAALTAKVAAEAAAAFKLKNPIIKKVKAPAKTKLAARVESTH